MTTCHIRKPRVSYQGPGGEQRHQMNRPLRHPPFNSGSWEGLGIFGKNWSRIICNLWGMSTRQLEHCFAQCENGSVWSPEVSFPKKELCWGPEAQDRKTESCLSLCKLRYAGYSSQNVGCPRWRKEERTLKPGAVMLLYFSWLPWDLNVPRDNFMSPFEPV